MKKDEFKKLLKIFKSETLRKYWRILREINDMNLLIKTIKENKEVINNPCFKLLPVINNLLNFIKEKKKRRFQFGRLFQINQRKQREKNSKTKKFNRK
jgi:hypothetical protein